MQCSYPLPSFRARFPPSLPSAAGIDSREALSRRVSLVDRIVEGIAELVVSGKLRNGDPLPSQEELARLFGVSRPSLREALHRMEVLGVVEAKQGKGTFVRDSSRLTAPAGAVRAPDYPTVAGLFITLFDVEPAVAALAAINASEPGLSALRDSLDRGEVAARERDLPGFLAHDLTFHSAVAELPQNRMLARTVEFARGLLGEAITASTVALPSDLVTCVVHHGRVAGAVFSGDAKAAYREMQAEIDHTLGYNVELIRELAPASW